jgi:hypothetical protein
MADYDIAFNDEKKEFPELDFTYRIGIDSSNQIIEEINEKILQAEQRLQFNQSQEDTGQISNAKYLGVRDWNLRLINTYTNQLQTVAQYTPTPIISEETFSVTVYELDELKPSGFDTQYYSKVTEDVIQVLNAQRKLFYKGNHQIPSLEFIKNHYGYTEPPIILSTQVQNIINQIESGQIIIPTWFNNNISWVKEGKITNDEFINSYNKIEPEESEPEELIWIYHIYQDGTYRRLHVTQNFIDVQTERGWIFSLTEPEELGPEELKNEDISIIFTTGSGGDLKTHFDFSSLIVTREIADKLRTWIFENYGMTILSSKNNYTNNLITHNLDEIKNLIKQKIKDDEPEPQDNSSFTFPMVSQLGVEFELKDNRVKGRVVLNKITANWNPYYNDMNLISYFELRNKNGVAISSLAQVKQNIVKFPPSQPPLLPSQELTFDESAVDYKELQVKIYLWTENNVRVAEPLIFAVKEDDVPIDVVNPIKRDDFMSKAVGVFGGLLGISLLISGNQKV